MPPIPTDYYNVSSCKSDWVTPDMLWKWYTTHNNLAVYRIRHDKSGMHQFDSMAGLTEFIENFAHGQKDACFLAGLAQWRGDSALEWFSADLPTTVPLLDGFGHTTPVQSVASTPGSRTSRGREVENYGGKMDDLISILGKRKHDDNSPEKKQFFRAKTTQIYEERISRQRRSNIDLATKLMKTKALFDGDMQLKMEARAKTLVEEAMTEQDQGESTAIDDCQSLLGSNDGEE